MCTSIVLKANDGSIVHGRTNEFGTYYKNDLLLYPRNFKYSNTVYDDIPKLFTSKYAYFASNCGNVLGDKFSGDNFIQDALNEKGLSISVHYYPQYATYKLVKKIQESEIDFISLTQHIISQCSSIDQVINLIEKYKSKVVLTEGQYVPGHIFVVDSSGRNIAIEPNEPGILNVVEGNGIFTNSPNYEFHLENLNNYSNIQVYDMKQKSILGDNVNSFGVSGGYGVPFDTSPPSRFVRATYLRNTTTKKNLDNSDDITLRMQRILNSFDIIPGQALREVNQNILGESPNEIDSNSVETDFKGTVTAHTDHIFVKDLVNIKYYYKDWKNQNWRFVQMSDYDLNVDQIRRIKMIEDKVPTAVKVILK